jgi:hypothetical protein
MRFNIIALDLLKKTADVRAYNKDAIIFLWQVLDHSIGADRADFVDKKNIFCYCENYSHSIGERSSCYDINAAQQRQISNLDPQIII